MKYIYIYEYYEYIYEKDAYPSIHQTLYLLFSVNK